MIAAYILVIDVIGSLMSPANATLAAPGSEARKPYHHGHLREALIDAALRLAEEEGLDGVSMREVARRVGVSSGAPFRHFPDKTALLTAIAETAMQRFRAEIAVCLAEAPEDDPIARIRSMGVAYLRWAMRNPTHFKVISARSSIDFEGSASLKADNAAIQAELEALLAEAARRGLLRFTDTRLIPLTARALVYGLARMLIDGHFPSWDVPEDEVGAAMDGVLDLFIASLLTKKS